MGEDLETESGWAGENASVGVWMRGQGIYGAEAETMMSGRRSPGRDEGCEAAFGGRRSCSLETSRRGCPCGGERRGGEAVDERRSEEG